MEKKAFIGILVFIHCFIFLSTFGFAEVHSQKKGLFSVDVPEGWEWREDAISVVLIHPNANDGLVINFDYKGLHISLQQQVAVWAAKLLMPLIVGPMFNGKIVSEEDIEISGVPARQFNITTSHEGNTVSSKAALFFHKGYVFMIMHAVSSDESRDEMDNIMKSFKLGGK